MASTTQSRSNVGDLLKDVYVGDLQETIQNEVMFYKDASRKQMPLDGTDLIVDVHLARNSGYGSRPITDPYPEARAEIIKKAALRCTRTFAGFVIDIELMKLSKRDEAAFASAVDVLMDSPKAGLVKQLERQACGAGNGILATLTAATVASATVTVDTTQFLEEGMVVDGWSTPTSTTKSSDSVVISTIDSDTQVTLTATTSLASGGVLRLEDSSADVGGTLTHYEMNGILNIADSDTNFMGLAYATYRRWRSVEFSAASAEISPALISKLLLQMRAKSAVMPDVVWSHPNNAYGFIYGGNGTYPDVRFTTANMSQVGSDKGNDGNGVEISLGGKRAVLRTSVDFSKTDVVAFNKADLLYGELNGVELEDGDGTISALRPVIDGNGAELQAVRGWFGWRGNLGCYRRNSFGRIYSLGTPTGL